MTTEVAILNKSAVALAADSAVTITRRAPGEDPVVTKIFVDANKLFELVKGVPVGVMIYNSAELAGIPWETLIKVYRSKNPRARFESLDAYVDDFLGYIEAAVPDQLDESTQKLQLIGLVDPMFSLIYDAMVDSLRAEKSRLKRRDMIAQLLDGLEHELDNARVQSWATGIDEDELWRIWGVDVYAVLPDRTAELTLTKAIRRRLSKLLLRAILRVEDVYGVWSGLVIAGFGEEQMFPCVYHAKVGGFIAGKLVKVQVSTESIDNDRPAIIQPYAQTSEAIMFLQGIDPAVSNAVSSFWHKWSRGVRSDAVKIIKKESPRTSQKHVNAIDARLSAYMEVSWKAFADYMNKEFHLRRLEPIEASAGFLSKGEIADLAENLVDLTSLRNRVSLDRQETVGGVTDVAVISRGDGFVWVKRKHYFERDRNPTWGLRQTLVDVASAIGSTDMGSGHGRTD